jgi:peptidoglycan glycosyltransferase
MTGGSGGGPSIGRAGRSRHPVGPNIARVGIALSVAFGALAAGAGYWQVVRSAPLAAEPDNPAVVAAQRQALRGRIVDRDGAVLADNKRDSNGEPYRVYRDPAMSPVIGYASRLFGTAGLERTYDAELVGATRPDPVSDMLKKFEADPYDPQQLTLSISLPLQRAAVRALGNDRGAVVMLDPRTGEVLVLASTPTYDASPVANPDTSEQAFNQLRTSATQPLLPRATLGQYVPGSVLKIVTALAGLDSGAVTPDTTYAEQPRAEKDGLVVSGFRIRDGHHPETGSKALDFYEATEVSCNIWYALTGLRTGGDRLAAMAQRLGFGQTVPFDLPIGRSQLTNGGGNFGGGFKDAVELANASYGQAETLVTPIQMALVAATVANRGVLMAPHLVTSFSGRKSGTTAVQPQAWRQVVSAQVADEVRQAMERAVEGSLGRLFTTGAKIPGVPTAGKSGTAQLGGKGEPNSWFIGFAPADNPQVAIAIVVEQGGRGGERAAPMAGSLMALALKTLGRQ